MHNLLLDVLSTEIVNHICSYLDIKSLCTVSQVCHALYSVSTDAHHWRYMCHNHFQLLHLKNSKPANYGWKYWYSEVDRIVNNWQNRKFLPQTLEGHGAIWALIESSPDVLHIGAHDNTIRTWDLRTAQNVHILRRIPAFSNVPINYSHIHVGKDNSVLVVADSHTCLRVFELKTTKMLYEIPLTVTITVLQLGRKTLAYASTEHKIHVIDIATNECLHLLEGHRQGIRCMQYDEERGLIATGSLDHTVRVWDLKTGECKVFAGHTMSVKCLQFEPKLNILISGSGDGTLRGWALDSGECIKIEPVERILALGFNGKFIVTASTSKIIVRDFNTWKFLYDIWTGPIGCLLVQDTRIIAGSKNVIVYSFDADQDSIDRYLANEAAEAARNRTPRQKATWRNKVLHSTVIKVVLACLFVVIAVLLQMYLSKK